MQIDPQDRERLIRVIRPLIRDAEHRFNECKQNLEPGSTGGYPPELKEACALLKELEQGELGMAPLVAASPMHSLEDCKEQGAILGMTTKDAIDFFLQYNPNWVRGHNNKPMVNLNEEMWRWQRRSQAETAEPVRNAAGKTPRELDREHNG